MKNISYTLLKNQLKENLFDNLYVFHGPNIFLINKYTKIIIEKTLNSNKNSFNFIEIDEEINFEKLDLAINSIPLSNEKRIILIKRIKFKNSTTSIIDYFLKLISNPYEFTIIILEISEEDNKKKILDKILKIKTKNATIVEFPQIVDKNVLKRQVVIWAKEFDKKITIKTADFFLKKCSNDLGEIHNNLIKVCFSVKEANCEIDESHINFILAKDNIKEVNIFNINKFLIQKKIDEIYKALKIILIKEEPLSVIYVISSLFIDAYRIKVALENNKNLDDISSDFEYKNRAFILQTVTHDFKNVNKNNIKKCINIILETESLIKSSDLNSRYLLEEMIIKIFKYM